MAGERQMVVVRFRENRTDKEEEGKKERKATSPAK